MKYEAELRKGIFVIPECSSCNKIVWPPSQYCDTCFGETIWRKGPDKGRIIESFKQDESTICLVDFGDNLKIIGKLTKYTRDPQIGDTINLESCGIRDNNHYFELSLS